MRILTSFLLLLCGLELYGCAWPAGVPSLQRAQEPDPRTAAMPLTAFLGQRRHVNEGLLGTRSGSDDNAWVRYGRSWAVRYKAGCAIELAVLTRRWTPCDGVAHLGIGAPVAASTPFVCSWNSLNGQGNVLFAGSLDRPSGLLRAFVTGGKDGC